MKKIAIILMLTFCFFTLTAASSKETTNEEKVLETTEKKSEDKTTSEKESSKKEVTDSSNKNKEVTEDPEKEQDTSSQETSSGNSSSKKTQKQETVRVYIKNVPYDPTRLNGAYVINNGTANLFVDAGVSSVRPVTTWLEYKQNRKVLYLHLKERVDQIIGGTVQDPTAITSYQLTFPVDNRTQQIAVVWE